MRTPDPITYEVIRNALLMTAAEMKVVVMKTAYAPIWKEAGDLSCGILNADGDLVAQGPGDQPVHLASMPFSVRGALEKIGRERIEPGDVLFHNDPAWGNNHLPDCIMIKPIFSRGRIIAYAAVRGHWTDIGGMGAGSYTAVTNEIYQEGLRIPPARIYKRGELDRELLDLILANVRCPEERVGDFRAQFAGCVTGERRLLSLLEKYGHDVVVGCMEDILDHSERLTRQEIEKIPDGVYRFTDYCDGDGVVDETIRIQVTVTVRGSDIVVDYTGSGPQTVGGMNCPIATTWSATLYAIKAATDPWNPANSGSYRPVKVIAPEGTVVNARIPASVVASNAHTANIMVDAIFGALGQAVPERVVAAGCGSSVVILVGGVDPRPEKRGRRFVYNEPHGGAWGARFAKDGLNATRVGTGNTSNHPVEVVEAEYPIRVDSYEIVPDRCGAGRFRGGLPVRRVYRLLGDAMVNITAERSRVPAHGLAGGNPGAPAEFTVNPGGPAERTLFSKTAPFPMRPGERISVQPAGGGGFGNPRERDPERVRQDVLNGYISLERARLDYGVVLDPETLEIVQLER